MTPEIIAIIDGYDTKIAHALTRLGSGNCSPTEYSDAVFHARERLIADLAKAGT